MNGNRRLWAVLLVLLLLPMQVRAETAVETDRAVSLTVQMKSGEIALRDAPVQLYHISSMDSGGELTPLPQYSAFSQLLDIRGENAQSWQEAAVELEQYILFSDMLPTAEAATNRAGTALFRNIPQGLYLVLSVHHQQDSWVYSTAPFFLQLPGKDPETFAWQYAVTAQAKPEASAQIIDLQAVKLWKDKFHEDERPETIQLTLYCDGDVWETVTISREDRWRYTWNDLPAAHSWHLEEKEIPGYRSRVKKEGNTFRVTNTILQDTSASRLPQTGQLWWPVPLLAVGGLLLLTTTRKRRDHE